MGINEIIIFIMMVFMVLGAVDRAIGNRFGLGEQFEEGFNALGPLALGMVGMVSLAPVLAKLLEPVVVPVYTLLGADPGMFAGTLIANDMGGYPLAMEMAQNRDAGLLSGTILAAMMGCTIVFTIPVALGIIQEDDRPQFAQGILIGIVTIPVGVLAGGLVAGFPLMMVFTNLIPIIIAALLIAFGLWKFPEFMTRAFLVFGKVLIAVLSLSLAVATFEYMTEIQLMPDGWEMAPVTDGLMIVAVIGLVLLGAFPAVHVILKLATTPLTKAGKLMGVSDVSSGGLVITLANALPTMQMMKDMDARGKVLNSAFMVSAIATFGDHLGFTAGVESTMIMPMIIGKLVAAVSALALALVMLRKRYPAHVEDVASSGGAGSAPEQA